MKAPRNGPHSYWSEDVKPSRGQWQTIAELALELLGEQLPQNRLAASQAIGTLHAGLEQPSQRSTVPTSKPGSRRTGGPRTNGVPPAGDAAATTAGGSGASAASGSSRARRTGVRTAASTRTGAG